MTKTHETAPLRLDEAGSKVWQEVLGQEYFDKAIAGVTALNRHRIEFVNNQVFKGTWARRIIPLPQLRLITMSILAGGERWEEFELHFRNAILSGDVPLPQLGELLNHIDIYCGFPAGKQAMSAAQRVIEGCGIDPGEFALDAQAS